MVNELSRKAKKIFASHISPSAAPKRCGTGRGEWRLFPRKAKTIKTPKKEKAPKDRR